MDCESQNRQEFTHVVNDLMCACIFQNLDCGWPVSFNNLNNKANTCEGEIRSLCILQTSFVDLNEFDYALHANFCMTLILQQFSSLRTPQKLLNN